MPNALTINGVEFPMESGAPSRTRVYVGSHGIRSQGGVPRSSARARTFDYKGKTPLVSGAESEAYRALLEGDGHTLDFEPSAGNPTGFATSRGLMPSSVGVAEVFDDTGNSARHGHHYMWTGGVGEALSYDLGEDFAGAWTVLAWRRISGTWQHCVLTSDGDDYYNGVSGATPGSLAWADVSGTTLSLVGTAEAVDFDDVVLLPYVILPAWAPGLYTFHALRAFPGLPYVAAGGRMVQRASGVECMGEVTDFKQEDFGTLLEAFDFTLRGVP